MSHFNGKRFFNPGARGARGLADVLRWKLTSRAQRSPAFIDDVKSSVPERKVEGLRATFVNHSTVLLQHRGLNILTDPVWSERASPVSWAGPRRHRAPGVQWVDLPPIDLVLLTHNHYDHLDLPTLLRLDAEHHPEFVVPLKLTALLKKNGLANTRELDWGDAAEIRGLHVRCVPAVHFSARGLWDRDKTLWCGYVVDSDRGPVYFAGDTAFGPHFSAIRKQCGNVRLAFLPIGAYLPGWMMSGVHMNPEEALRAHRILCAETSVAIHHGTFQLADDSIEAPAKELLYRIGRTRPEKPFIVPANGESVTLEDPSA